MPGDLGYPLVPMTPELASKEYAALRDTIRERGTARIVVFVGAITAWAALATATASFLNLTAGALLPLVVLVAGFEAVYALHTGVERIGRYLQAFYEQPEGPSWETTLHEHGQKLRAGPDSLFTYIFTAAVLVNLLLASPSGTRTEAAALTLLHLAFVTRLLVARARAAQQRAADWVVFDAAQRDRKKRSPDPTTR